MYYVSIDTQIITVSCEISQLGQRLSYQSNQNSSSLSKLSHTGN